MEPRRHRAHRRELRVLEVGIQHTGEQRELPEQRRLLQVEAIDHRGRRTGKVSAAREGENATARARVEQGIRSDG